MIRYWSIRLGATTLCGLVLTACTGDPEPRPPVPSVTAHEFEQRLTEHLSRFVTEVLEADAHASTPAHSRTVGCADAPDGGPAWGVVPRAQITVSAGEKAEKYFEDLETWTRRNGFDDPAGSWPDNKQPNKVWVFEAAGTDGVRLVMELPPKSPQFTVALTAPCGWPSDRPGGPPSSGQLRPLQPSSGPEEVWEQNSEDACRSPKLYVYNSAASPFAGPGPHLIKLITYRYEESVGYVSLPADWMPPPERDQPGGTDHRVQLVVCVRVDATRDSGRDVTCTYSFSTLPGAGTPYTFDVYESIYHVAVLEARSGKKISEFSVPGRQPDRESCPETMGDFKRTLVRGIDQAAFESKLRPLVSSPR